MIWLHGGESATFPTSLGSGVVALHDITVIPSFKVVDVVIEVVGSCEGDVPQEYITRYKAREY